MNSTIYITNSNVSQTHGKNIEYNGRILNAIKQWKLK